MRTAGGWLLTLAIMCGLVLGLIGWALGVSFLFEHTQVLIGVLIVAGGAELVAWTIGVVRRRRASA